MEWQQVIGWGCGRRRGVGACLESSNSFMVMQFTQGKTHPLQVFDSVVFSAFQVLQPLLYLVLEHFHCPQEKLLLFS